MAFLFAAPEVMTAAASDLSGITSAVTAAHASVASAIGGVLPAAGDEVSAGIAQLFTQFGQEFQALTAKAVPAYNAFAQNLANGAASYQDIEALGSQLLADLTGSVNGGVNGVHTGIQSIIADITGGVNFLLDIAIFSTGAGVFGYIGAALTLAFLGLISPAIVVVIISSIITGMV
jgi:PE family